MDEIEREIRNKFRRYIKEGDVIQFPKKKKTIDDRMRGAFDDFAASMVSQNDVEEWTVNKAHEITSNGEAAKKKWNIPFIMKNYQDDTNPVMALLWTLEEYLAHGESEEYSKEQIRFSYEFLDKHLEQIVDAIKSDINKIEFYKKQVKDNPEVPLADYAIRPLQQIKHQYKEMINTLQHFRMYDGIFSHPERIWGRKSQEVVKSLFEDEISNDRPFTDETGMPFYDEMLEKPEYFEEAKGIIWMLDSMSPEEYMQKCAVGARVFHGFTGDLKAGKQKDRAEKYARAMLEGAKFPLLVLDYSNLDFTQEGYHRAWAAKLAGYETVPVMVVDNTAEKKKALRQSNAR